MKEKLKQRIIELIHGVPYEEARYLETPEHEYIDTERQYSRGDIKPITIGRVMQALLSNPIPHAFWAGGIYRMTGKIIPIEEYLLSEFVCNWQNIKEDGQECTLDDQTEETLEALYKLFQK